MPGKNLLRSPIRDKNKMIERNLRHISGETTKINDGLTIYVDISRVPILLTGKRRQETGLVKASAFCIPGWLIFDPCNSFLRIELCIQYGGCRTEERKITPAFLKAEYETQMFYESWINN